MRKTVLGDTTPVFNKKKSSTAVVAVKKDRKTGKTLSKRRVPTRSLSRNEFNKSTKG